MLIGRLRDAGGAEMVFAGLACHLPRERFDVTVCTTRVDAGRLDSGSGHLDGMLRAAGIRRVRLERRRRSDVLRMRHLVTLLRRERVQVLHAHMFGSNVWAALLGRLCRVPVVIAHEHGSSDRQLGRRLVNRFVVSRLVTRVVAVSEAERRRLIVGHSAPAEKIVVIPNAYIPRPSGGGDLRRELGIGPEVPVVGTIAQLRPEKAIDLLLEAFARARRSLPDARLVIAGSGRSHLGGLREHAERLGVADGVHFLGHRNDTDAVLAALDVAAISSRREGSPLFACEALANGVPLVSTDVGGVREIVDDAAVLVPAGEPEVLGDRIAELLDDPDRRRRLAKAGRSRVSALSIDRLTGDVAALYERLLREHRSG